MIQNAALSGIQVQVSEKPPLFYLEFVMGKIVDFNSKKSTNKKESSVSINDGYNPIEGAK